MPRTNDYNLNFYFIFFRSKSGPSDVGLAGPIPTALTLTMKFSKVCPSLRGLWQCLIDRLKLVSAVGWSAASWWSLVYPLACGNSHPGLQRLQTSSPLCWSSIAPGTSSPLSWSSIAPGRLSSLSCWSSVGFSRTPLSVPSYLRTTMSQLRLNHLVLLHGHKDRTDKLNLKWLRAKLPTPNKSISMF